jgi:S-ribosylhomocysteine lyase LuxS involved in autoinducer biosynthesis
VESVSLYASEIWTLNEYYRKRLQAVEMDYLKSARVSRLEHISNQEIRTRMNAEESTVCPQSPFGVLKNCGHTV